MPDRRPSKLYVDTTEATDLSDNNRFTEASPADLLAVVRRGVESGTIKGTMLTYYYDGFYDNLLNDHEPLRTPALEDGRYIVIGPVSDGGSET